MKKSSKRIRAFAEICEKEPYKAMALQLKESEFDNLVEFIEDNDHLEYSDFDEAIGVAFADKKKKHLFEFQRILFATNDLAFKHRRKASNEKRNKTR